MPKFLTSKAFRKKRARKATRKSRARNVRAGARHYTLNFELSVSLLGDKRYLKANVEDHAKQVIDWYNTYARYDDSFFKMKHLGGNKFEITVDVPIEELPDDPRNKVRFIERIVDPGGSRDYPPIKIKGQEFNVWGRLLSVDGTKIQYTDQFQVSRMKNPSDDGFKMGTETFMPI